MEQPILDIPFDEPDGSTIAYDYAPGGHHAQIEAGRFIPGKFGNCVYFPAEGKAEVFNPVVNYAADFTVDVWVKADSLPEGPTKTWALFKFPGPDNFISIDLFTPMTYWQNVAVVQKGYNISVWVDGVKKGEFTRPMVMTGFAILNNASHDTGGFCSLDRAKVYDIALTPDQIGEIIENVLQPVEFHINNINTKALGIVIESFEGLFSLPERKDPLTFDWPDYHGKVIDLVKPVVDVREMELNCWIKAASQDELISKQEQIKDIFRASGAVRLQVDAGTKPLIFDVYHPGALDFEGRMPKHGPYASQFTLGLTEFDPVKRILKVSGNSVSITLSSNKLLTISWGDGTVTNNVSGEPITVTHSYTQPGDKYVSIGGVIEDIYNFSTDAVVVWGKI